MLTWGVNLDHLSHRAKGNRSTLQCVTVNEGQTRLKRAQLGVKDKRAEDTSRNVTFTQKCAQQEAGGGVAREGSILAGEIRQ